MTRPPTRRMRTHRNHAAAHKRRQKRQTRLNRHRGVRLRTRDALPDAQLNDTLTSEGSTP